MRPVPVLMYHHVNPHKGDMVTVTPEVFAGQMAHLGKAGYRVLSLEELLACIRGDLTLKQKAVAITFDDGWLDNYLYAFPILEKHRFPATIFVVTDWAERASENTAPVPLTVPTHKESKRFVEGGEEHKVVLTWELAQEMAGTGLIDFCSHTKSHRRCDQLPEDMLLEELGGSRQIMEARLGKPCPSLCWPYGKYSAAAIRIARSSGYGALFTTHPGVVRIKSDPLFIKRIVVKDDIAWFKKRMVIYTNPVLSACYLKLKKK